MCKCCCNQYVDIPPNYTNLIMFEKVGKDIIVKKNSIIIVDCSIFHVGEDQEVCSVFEDIKKL